MPFLSNLNLVVVLISLALYLISCIGVTPFDKMENFEGVSVEKPEDAKPSLRDMGLLMKDFL